MSHMVFILCHHECHQWSSEESGLVNLLFDVLLKFHVIHLFRLMNILLNIMFRLLTSSPKSWDLKRRLQQCWLGGQFASFIRRYDVVGGTLSALSPPTPLPIIQIISPFVHLILGTTKFEKISYFESFKNFENFLFQKFRLFSKFSISNIL